MLAAGEEEGFDAETIRVLVAWMHSAHAWKKPERGCPDDGRPTARAWAWLVSGMALDYVAIADAANVSRGVARARLGVLLGNRLIYPDGSIAQPARAALQSAIASRVKQKKKKPDAAKAEGVN